MLRFSFDDFQTISENPFQSALILLISVQFDYKTVPE